VGTSKTDKGESNLAPSGSTTLTLKKTGSESEQINRATIGQGEIIVDGKIAASENSSNGNQANGSSSVDSGKNENQIFLPNLNRDINNTQEITKDLITGALDGSVTVDNRLFTEEGRKSIVKDFENFGVNLVKTAAGAVSTVVSPVMAVYGSITAESNDALQGEDKKDIISVWKANQSGNATGILRGGSEDASAIVEKIKEGTASPEEIQALANMTSEGKGNLIYNKEGEIVDKNTGKIVLGFSDLEGKQGYVNAGNGAATNALTFMLTDAEERAHNQTANESIAKGAASSELTYYNAVAWLTGGTTVTESNSGVGGYGTQAQSNWNNTFNTITNELLRENTSQASEVSDKDKAYLTIYVPGTALFGRDKEDKKSDQKTAELLKEGFKDEGEAYVLDWSGENTKEARAEAAKKLVEKVNEYEFAEGEKLNVVGFSHGGNAAKESTKLELDKKIDNLMFIGTPHIFTHQLNYNAVSETGNIYNFYDRNDLVQGVVGGTSWVPNFFSNSSEKPAGLLPLIVEKSAQLGGVLSNPSQTINNPRVNNIEINSKLNLKREFIVNTVLTPVVTEILKIEDSVSIHLNMNSDKNIKAIMQKIRIKE
jgi:hypothetical protein